MSNLYRYVYRYLYLVFLSLTLLVGGPYGERLYSSNQKAKELDEIIKPDQTIQTVLKAITSNEEPNKIDSFKEFDINIESIDKKAYTKLFKEMEIRVGGQKALVRQILYFGAKDPGEHVLYSSVFILKYLNVSKSSILNILVPLLNHHNHNLNEVIKEVLEIMAYNSKKRDWSFVHFENYISGNINRKETVLLLKIMYDFDRRATFRIAMSTFGKKLQNNKYNKIRSLHQDIEKVLRRIKDLQGKMTSNRHSNKKQKPNKQDLQKNLTNAKNTLKNKINILMRYPHVWIEWYILQILKNHHNLNDPDWVEGTKNKISD